MSTFTRNSIAYRKDGTLINANFPRFEAGRFDQAMMVEEGTTNLLTANQANIETDITGFAALNSVLTRDLSQFWSGTSSLRITTNNSTLNEGVRTTDIPVNVSANQTVSVWIRGTGNHLLQLHELTATSVLIGITQVGVMATSNWTRHTVTRLFGSTGVIARIQVIRIQQDVSLGSPAALFPTSIIYNLDGLQLEQRPYATSWQLGGTPRAAETVTIPTAGVLSPTEGTIEFWTRPNHASTVVAADGLGFHHLAWISGTTGFALRRVLGAIVFVSIRTAGDLLITHNMTWTAGQDIYLAVRWTATDVSLFVDGVLRGTAVKFDNPSSIPLEFGWRTGHTPSNALHDDLRISNRARTDQEIADAFASGQPLQLDASTTALHNFNNLITSQVFHHAGNTPAMVVPRAVVNPGLVYVGLTVVETVAASELRQAQNITGLTTISVIAKSLFRRTINIKSPTHAVIKDSRTRVVLK